MGSDHHHPGQGDQGHPGVAADTTLSKRARRILAMEELLAEKGVIGSTDVQRLMEVIAARSPVDGARVVARAWTDPDFKSLLLKDSRKALAEMGFPPVAGAMLVVVENTEEVHHLVVCTLCSCYPTSLLGPPPDWYKSFAYRSRAVIDPRGVMREFGLEVGEEVEVRVVDSAADLRYMVLPRRPEGTEGMEEPDLVALVSRDSLVGTGTPVSSATASDDSGAEEAAS